MKKKTLLKLFSIILSIVVMTSIFTGCQFYKISEGEYNFVAPDGAPFLAVTEMWENKEEFSPANMSFELTAESNLAPKFQAGKDAFITAPINVGANIHKAYLEGKINVDYRLLNVVSWGVLYIVTTDDSIKSREDSRDLESFLNQFNDKNIPVIGLAAIPGKSLDYILKENGVRYELSGSDATTIQQSLNSGSVNIALLGEPAITATKQKNSKLRSLCSISEIYKEMTGKNFPMAGCFVRGDLVEENKGLVSAVDRAIKSSCEYFNNNPLKAGEKAKDSGGSLPPAVVQSAASKMNVIYKNAKDSKEDVKYLLSCIGQSIDDDLFISL